MAKPLSGLSILITGASIGIGKSIAIACANVGAAALILFARSEDKLQEVASEIKSTNSETRVFYFSVDIRSFNAVDEAVKKAVQSLRDAGISDHIDALINNAGLALGAPNTFPDLKIEDIDTMLGSNVNGMMYVTHAVLNSGGMMKRSPPRGTILNITSVTGLEVPPFPGEAIYHTSKAAQEAFTNVLRTELQKTNIKVIALRPGVVATNFHQQRVGYDKDAHDDFMSGFEPLIAEDIAQHAVWMLSQPERISVKALDVVPSAQRTLQVIDKTWNERNQVADTKM